MGIWLQKLIRYIDKNPAIKANLKSFAWVFEILFVELLISGMIFELITNAPVQSIGEALFAPIFSIKAGFYLVPFSSLLMAAVLMAATALVWYEKFTRFLGLQLFGLLFALLIGATCSVMIEGYLFQELSHFVPWPQYIFNFIAMREANPGQHVLLSCLIGFGVVFFFYISYIAKIFFNIGKPLGTARFATGLDLYRAGLFAKYGFVLAKSWYGQLKFSGFELIIFVAGTGGGKTKAVVIPNLLELRNENIVVTDIKGEIYAATHQYRQALGQAVYRFEPESATTHRYNPLGLLRPTHMDEDLDVIFKTLIPDTHDPLWADSARNIAKMMVMYQLLECKKVPTLQSIYQMVCMPNFSEQAQMMYETTKTPRVANLFGKFLSAREKTQRDMLLSAQEYLSKFDSPNLAYATGGNDFDLRDLRKKPMTIYFIMPANTQTFNAIAAVFFEQMVRLTTEKNEPDASEYSINAIIDEFGNLPMIPSLARGISFLRSYRLRVCAFVQQISQLKAIYGQDRKEGFMAAPVKVAFDIGSKEDAFYFSALSGKKTIKVKNETVHQDMSMNVSTHMQHRELLSPDELMRLGRSKLLIYRTGFHVTKAKKNFWFQKKYYKNLLKLGN